MARHFLQAVKCLLRLLLVPKTFKQALHERPSRYRFATCCKSCLDASCRLTAWKLVKVLGQCVQRQSSSGAWVLRIPSASKISSWNRERASRSTVIRSKPIHRHRALFNKAAHEFLLKVAMASETDCVSFQGGSLSSPKCKSQHQSASTKRDHPWSTRDEV